MNLDGHGSPRLKSDIYNRLYNREISKHVAGGLKLFFSEDRRPAVSTISSMHRRHGESCKP